MRNRKKLESWIRDFLIEENARFDWGVDNAVEDITNIVFDWLEEEQDEKR